MRIRINDKAILDSNLTGVEFDIGCNDGGATDLNSICPNVAFTPPAGRFNLVVSDVCDAVSAGIAGCLSGVDNMLLEWVFIAPDCEGAAQKKVNPKTVPCSQDANWDLEGAVFVDVVSYQGSIKELICNKKTNTFFWVTGADTGQPCVVGGDPQPPGADD
jgi:hypothetical protein